MRIAIRIDEGLTELASALAADGAERVACADEAQAVAATSTCDVLVVNGANYTKALAEALHGPHCRVRWIQFAAAGIDAAARHGIPPGIVLTNAAEAFAPTVAEHAFALLLAGYRRIVEMDRVRTTPGWTREAFVPRLESVEGATLVVVGYGHVAREIVRRARAFAMRPLVVTRRAEAAVADGVEARPLSALTSALADADAVIVAVALVPETRHLLGASELAAMKPTAWFVNVGRGGVVDEEALIEVLRHRRIGGAALDVFADEPLPSASPLRTMDNVIVTPHVAGFGGAAMRARMASIVADNVRRYAAGAPLRNLVDLPAGIQQVTAG